MPDRHWIICVEGHTNCDSFEVIETGHFMLDMPFLDGIGFTIATVVEE